MTKPELNRVYPRVVYQDRRPDGTECWVASHPDLPGCEAEGNTPEDAKAALDQARASYLGYLINKGQSVPANPPTPQLRFAPDWQLGAFARGTAVVIQSIWSTTVNQPNRQNEPVAVTV